VRRLAKWFDPTAMRSNGRSLDLSRVPSRMRHAACVLMMCLLWFVPASLPWAREVKPKFGPDAISIERSHAYLQRHAAPDYWRLSPYYVPQATDSDCSLAAIAMLLNALRGLPALDDQQVVTEDGVLRAVASAAWTRQTAENGSGVSFAALSRYLRLSLDAFHVNADIEILKPADHSAATLTKLRRILAANERTDRDIVLAYFNQGVLTGSWDGPHISPIGAYDAAHGQVLIMDVDRKWYIPYWASDEKLLAAMLHPAPANQGRLAGETGGLVRVILKSSAPR
jgi:hypothetical protein